MSIPNILPLRKRENIGQDFALQDIKIDEVQNQASAIKVVQDSAPNSARFRTYVGEGFYPVDIETGIYRLEQALGVKNKGRIMLYLIKHVRFGNVAYVSPTAISGDLGIHLTHVRRDLAKLIAEGHIAHSKTENQGHAYIVSPKIGVKGGAQYEPIAREAWKSFGMKRTKEAGRKIKLKSFARIGD